MGLMIAELALKYCPKEVNGHSIVCQLLVMMAFLTKELGQSLRRKLEKWAGGSKFLGTTLNLSKKSRNTTWLCQARDD